MQGVYPRFSRTPGRIERGAPVLGSDNETVYKGVLGLTDAELEKLAKEGVI
jgi:crotonobetainyl-CoA:carnitine CoA-transferase CaiB-like acyl-CoA transferase